MNAKNIILIIGSVVVASVLSTVITFKYIQSQSVSNLDSSSVTPSPFPLESMKTEKPNFQDEAASRVIPPPPSPRSPNSVNGTQALPQDIIQLKQEIEFNDVPKEFDPNYDSRKPLSLNESLKFLKQKASQCESDFNQLCTKSQFFIEHPLSCLRHNKDHLSRACDDKIRAISQGFRNACGSDIQRYCKRQARYHGCLKENLQQLSEDCKKSILSYSR